MAATSCLFTLLSQERGMWDRGRLEGEQIRTVKKGQKAKSKKRRSKKAKDKEAMCNCGGRNAQRRIILKWQQHGNILHIKRNTHIFIGLVLQKKRKVPIKHLNKLYHVIK